MSNEELSKAEKKERFVELRAKGTSYDNIAKQLKVSKPTLISWSKELSIEIGNLQEVYFDGLRERLAIGKQHRLQMLSEELAIIRSEFNTRGLGSLPTPQIFNMLMRLERRIAEEDDSTTQFREEVDDFGISTTTIEEWKG